MSFFIIQVQTHCELDVLKSLSNLLEQKKNYYVKSIYALNFQVKFKQSDPTIEEIRSYLEAQRIRHFINNMRYSYHLMDNRQIKLKNEYKTQINKLSKKIKEYPSHIKFKSLLKGYLLIELYGEFQTIPTDLYYDIKSIPKVIGFPSKYNIPSKEINNFFEKLKKYNTKNH